MQGFDYAAFPIHQQGQLTIYHDDAADEEVSIGIGKNNYDDRYTMDEWFRTDASSMVTGVEGVRGENVREVHMQPGERWTEAKYHAMNVRYQDQAMEQLRKLAKADKPFFLQYWPLYPLTGPRTTTDQYTTPNGGVYVEKMKLVDQWVGDLMAEMDKLGIADNTLVVIMGDNGHFTKYSPGSGYTPMVYKGGKGSTKEGGVRVDAFVRWPGMIEADSVAADIVHVTDLFTTLARLGGGTDDIPTDRVIDGIDQTSLMLNGDTFGRRDYVFLYAINTLEAVVKEQYKLDLSSGMENAILAKFYDLFRDTREEWPVSTQVGAWGGAKFVRMVKRHMQRKAKYPDAPPATGMNSRLWWLRFNSSRVQRRNRTRAVLDYIINTENRNDFQNLDFDFFTGRPCVHRLCWRARLRRPPGCQGHSGTEEHERLCGVARPCCHQGCELLRRQAWPRFDGFQLDRSESQHRPSRVSAHQQFRWRAEQGTLFSRRDVDSLQFGKRFLRAGQHPEGNLGSHEIRAGNHSLFD